MVENVWKPMEMYAFAKENRGLLNAQEKCETGRKKSPKPWHFPAATPPKEMGVSRDYEPPIIPWGGWH